jgi:hypothetical protein
MTAGTYIDVYIDCNDEKCIKRFFGSQAELMEGMTVTMVRKAAQDHGWQTGVRRKEGQRLGRPNSLMDFCPEHKEDEGK